MGGNVAQEVARDDRDNAGAIKKQAEPWSKRDLFNRVLIEFLDEL